MMYYDKYYSKCVCVCGIVFCIANMFFFSLVFLKCVVPHVLVNHAHAYTYRTC